MINTVYFTGQSVKSKCVVLLNIKIINVDSFIAFISILSALLGIHAFWKQYLFEPEETKRYLENIFQTTKKRNAQLLGELKDYVSINHTYDDHFMQGFSFSDAIQLLERCDHEIFSEDNIEIIRKNHRISRDVESLIDVINKHDLYVIQALSYFHNQFFKRDV